MSQVFSIIVSFIFIAAIIAFIQLFILNKEENKITIIKKGAQKMNTITATQIGEKFGKNAREINEIFLTTGYIEKDKNGWKVTNLGKSKGGIQNNFKGNLSVYWDEEILNDKILKNTLEPKQETQNFRDKFKAEYRTNDGHYVRSRAEVIISNWLFAECIAHAYEKRVPIEEDVYCDFYIPKGKIYIEFWGYEEDEKYLARKQKKLELYKKYNLNLIEIDNNTINNIDDFLPRELLKFGVSFS